MKSTINKKSLAAYLNISRVTLNKRLKETPFDMNDLRSILDWVIFEGIGYGKMGKFFSEYVYKHRGEKCQRCGTPYNLQISHIHPQGFKPQLCFMYKYVRVLCVDCHNIEEKHPLVGKDKLFKISPMVKQSTLRPA